MWNKQNDTAHNAAFAKARELAEKAPKFLAEIRQSIIENLRRESAVLDDIIDVLAAHS